VRKVLLSLVVAFFGAAVFAQTPAPSAQSVPPNPPPPTVEEPIELDTVMMESTFMIEGPAPGGGNSFGTVFIIARPRPNTSPLQAFAVLVTAAHVLEGIQGDFATLHLRQKVDEKTNQWVQTPFQLRIRSNNQALWVRNPGADVAAMNVALPDTMLKQIKPITPLMFVDDEKLVEYKINPGDEVRCLGYPLGAQSNEAGFPVLRSGKIASYPLTPTDQTKTFLVDLRIFKGNSGGPVFVVENNRVVPTMIGAYQNLHFIIGLVSEEKLFSETAIGPYSQELHQTQLGLAIVVHASLIMQTIATLPFPNLDRP
jgi:S1-C subfamily serine protease